MFNVGSDTQGDSVLRLQTPGIYKASLQSVEVKNIERKDGTIAAEKALVFSFNTTDGSFQHIEYQPNDKSTDKSIENLKKRVKHIMLRFMSEEQTHMTANNWDEYTAAIISKMNAAGYTEKDVWIKVIGNVYQGKANLQFPKYLGFISESDNMQLSKAEVAGNAEWARTLEEIKAAQQESTNLAEEPSLNDTQSDLVAGANEEVPF